MSYVRGEDRGQAALLPAAIEDYVAADAPVRVIDAFVDGLDVAGLGFGRSSPAATGRPPYDPRDLLKLYVYGYLNEVRSSRRLERESRRNVEVMWLLKRLAPDFKTIADFRRDNGTAVVGACRAFVLFCRDQGLFAARLVALDGSKFRAAASARRIMGRREIAKETAHLDGRIADYLAGLDESDAREPDEAQGATAVALQALKERRAELDRLAAKLDSEERATLVEGELDARPMGIGKGPKPPSYNVQTAVDADTGLILHHAVTAEPTDNRLLHPMAKAAKETLGAETLTVVADAGYSNGAAAAACEADGIVPCVPANRAINNQGDGTLFDRSLFTYEKERDVYRCPADRLLVRQQLHRDSMSVIYAAQDCSGCRLKPRCTTAKRRYVTRHLDDDALTRMNARVEADPDLMRRRRCASEHPFGTIKRMTAGGRFLTRGIEKAKAEAALSVLAYNILRAINLAGVAGLRARASPEPNKRGSG
jgi:transposase